jgi:hypothetical protein
MATLAAAAARSESRNSRRFALKLPVAVRCEDGTLRELNAETRDISAQGVFFYAGSHLQEGSPLEFTLTLPPEITLTESIRVRCRGRVVRVDSDSPAHVGIAAIIEQYDFVPETADA